MCCTATLRFRHSASTPTVRAHFPLAALPLQVLATKSSTRLDSLLHTNWSVLPMTSSLLVACLASKVHQTAQYLWRQLHSQHLLRTTCQMVSNQTSKRSTPTIHQTSHGHSVHTCAYSKLTPRPVRSRFSNMLPLMTAVCRSTHSLLRARCTAVSFKASHKRYSKRPCTTLTAT